MNADIFFQQIEGMNYRLAELYKGAIAEVEPPPELLPVAFKELGVVSEELNVAVEELRAQNDELIAIRQELEAERQRYKDLFEFAPDAYLVTDPEGVILEGNRAAAGLFNVSQKFLVGKPAIIFVSPEDRQLFRYEMSRRQQQERSPQEWEVRLEPRNGEPFYAAVTIAAACNAKGKALTLRWLVRDISDRKRKQQALDSINYDLRQNRQIHIYAKGEIVPLQPHCIWLVCQGLVKLSTLADNGEEVLVGLAGPGMPFGHSLTQLQTFQAIAFSDVQLASVSQAEITASPALTQMLFNQVNQRLRQTESLLAISGHRRVRDRLQHLLRLLKQEIGEPHAAGTRLNIRLTHQDLANACCTTRVTITRLLSTLQQQGKIILDSKHHIVLRDAVFEKDF